MATTGPAKGTSLSRNMPYDAYIVKIGLRAMAQRDPENKIK